MVFQTEVPEIADITKKTVATGSIVPRREGACGALAGQPVSEVVEDVALLDTAIGKADKPAVKPSIDPSGQTMATAGVPSPAFDATMAVERSGHPADDYTDLLTISPEHYVLDKEIARGGMGRIRVARDRRLGRVIAVKEILVKVGDAARRFEREARITARLQHPSIVNLHEAGVWPSGEPFYTMKLVTGRSLDEVILEAKTLDERLALLPNVLAVADAMAYAHGERVIHRDLKPKNVLVGGFGETVVIDWGLAKDLADPSVALVSAGGPFRDASAGNEGMTCDGEVMGTPAYMPPEQADGQSVDERADVYAIGALLYHVLSGHPPYSGSSSIDVLVAVMHGPPVSLAVRQPGIPPDLLAIVERSMARAPEGRYPTAGQLAQDLRRFQTGQLVGAHRYSVRQLMRRWLRRHRTAVSVAAVATLVLVVLGAVALTRIIRAEQVAEERRAQAEVQRVSAEANRGEAEDLLGFMLGELRDKLEPLGKLGLLDLVAKKAVAYYERRGENLSDAEKGKRATAQRNLGDVLWAQGNAEAALGQYRASLDLTGTLAAKDPTNTDWQRDLSVSYDRVGDVVLEQGDVAGALAAHRASLAIRDTLAANAPTHPGWKRAVSVSHDRIGDVLLAQGDVSGSLAAYRASLAIDETLVTKDPTNVELQRNLSVSHNKIGNVALAHGDAAGAIAAYQASLAIREMLTAKDPTNADLQRDLSVSHEKVGNVALVQGDVAGALAAYRASLAIRETLAAKDPTNASWQVDLSVSHEKVGNVARAQGDLAGALASHRASLAIDETLAAKDPTNAALQRDLSVSLDRVGNVVVAEGDVAGALAAFRASLAIREKLAAKDPTNADRQRDLSVSLENVGNVALAQRNVTGSLAAYRASLAIRETLAAKDPTDTGRQRDLSFGHTHLGDAVLAQGDAAGALAAYRASLEILETLAAKDPTNADWQRDLSVSHEKVGNVLLAQGDATGALAAYRAGLDIVQRLVAKDSKNADWSKLAASLAAKVATCCGTTTKKP